MRHRGPRFDVAVADGGYAWWYVDAVSDDGRHCITLIAFIGSVFSPYYARARARGNGDPREHCAVNVAIHGKGGRWAMTERDASALSCSPGRLAIGPSSVAWDGRELVIDLREVGVPLPRAVRGQVRVRPRGVCGDVFTLDARGRHRWRPFAPCAGVSVNLDRPSMRWSGHGYFDSNDGDEPLEDGFAGWHWSRARLRTGATAVLYDVRRRDGSEDCIAVRVAPDGSSGPFRPPGFAAMAPSGWRIERRARAEGGGARVRETLVDAPFYTRSLVETRLLGEQVTAMHESLSLDRFRAPWVRALLPFRMPRAVSRP